MTMKIAALTVALLALFSPAFVAAQDAPPQDQRKQQPAPPKPQPAKVKFRIPAVDAPNVLGASDLGFPVKATTAGAADVAAFRGDVEQGRVRALYVVDPGPEGSIGDVAWIVEARKSGRLPGGRKPLAGEADGQAEEAEAE